MGRIKFGLVLLLAALVLLLPMTQAQAASFSFNWTGTPATPQAWEPGAVNDWDLITNIDQPTDLNGTQDAVHGPACEPPPATHQIKDLPDSAFICNNHLMTAINGGGDAAVSYGAVYMAPSQLMDWSGGSSNLSWKISTQHQSARDWWQVDLTPFAENLVVPLQPWLPAYQGLPKDALELRLDNTNGCASTGGNGSALHVSTIANFASTDIQQYHGCIEDAVSGPSAAIRSQFQVEFAPGHLKVYMPRTTEVMYDGPISLSFNQAVVQFSHHSYNPTKENSGVPGTWHWSDVSISNAVPFTMLRPTMPHSLHAGGTTSVVLPQPVPANSFLRFAAMGQIKVGLNGGVVQNAVSQAQSKSSPEGFSSYWMSIPAGTTSLDFGNSAVNVYNQAWWIEDVSVWSLNSPAPSPTSAPTPAPTPAPAPAPQSITDLPCTVTFPVPQGSQTGHCTGTFTQS